MTTKTHQYYILRDDMTTAAAGECSHVKWKTLAGCCIVQLQVPNTRRYLAHPSESSLRQIVLQNIGDVGAVQWYMHALNTADETYAISNGVFAVLTSANKCTVYNIVGSRIYHEQDIRQAILHKHAAEITAYAKYTDVDALLADRYPSIHPDIFNEVKYRIHNMRVALFITEMVNEHGSLTNAKMDDYTTAKLDAAAIDTHANTPSPELTNTPLPTPTNTTPPELTDIPPSRRVRGRPPWNSNTAVMHRPNIKGGGAIFEPQDKQLHSELANRRQCTLSNSIGSGKKLWPSDDYTHAPIFYIIVDIDMCISSLANRPNSAMYHLCMFIRYAQIPPTDLLEILAAAIADLVGIVAGATTPKQKLDNIFAALRLNITNSPYIISELPNLPADADSADADDPTYISVMSAYITDDTYTDIEHSVEYKGAECYTILIGDNHPYPEPACYIYTTHIYGAGIQGST